MSRPTKNEAPTGATVEASSDKSPATTRKESTMNATTASARTATQPAVPDFDAERIAAAAASPVVTFGQDIQRVHVYECRDDDLRSDILAEGDKIAFDMKRLYRLVKGQGAVVTLLHSQHHMTKNDGRSMTTAGVAHQPLPSYVADELANLSLLLADEIEGLAGNLLYAAVKEDGDS